MINFRLVTNILGQLLLVIGLLMLTGIPFSLYYQSNDIIPLAGGGGLTLAAGLIAWWTTRSKGLIVNKREGYLIVTLAWLLMVSFGMLPYLFSGTFSSFTDAFFETMSGMTTTGASVLNDIEAVPAGILYWRSLTQWIGGMGIIVLTVAIFPLLGIGGSELFGAEAPGPTSDKIHPRIKDTARQLWFIYVGLTVGLMGLLWLLGMTFYDAVNHALTTMATGGFSTKNASMMAYDIPAIQYVVILFMLLAGTNYSILYLVLTNKWKSVWASEEFRTYLILIGVATVVIAGNVWYVSELGFEKSFRDSLFQVVSLVTTTGFVSADYTSWTLFVTMLCFILLFTGACAGSTSGGIKIIRHLVFFKNVSWEFKRLLHPSAVIPLKLDGSTVTSRIVNHITIFLLIYLLTFVVGILLLSLCGLDFVTAIGATATSLGNVGPGVGKVGPVDNFAWLPDSVKWILSILMLLGRLELFTVLVLFTSSYWRVN